MSSTLEEVRDGFLHPPDQSRVMMRWWWFGPAVTHAELRREILAMKQGGIGGIEIQPVYPMAPDDLLHSLRNLPFLSPEFADAVHFAAQTARENGMRVDITLGSGWPFGGPGVTVDEAAGKLRTMVVDLQPNTAATALPHCGPGEHVIAAFVGPGSAAHYDVRTLREVELKEQPRLRVDPSGDSRVIVLYVAGRTGQQVKRAAVGAEGYVVDHLDGRSVHDYLRNVGDPLLAAFASEPPYAVFGDSLETFGADWTPRLLEEFKARRGYALEPYLPKLVQGGDETSAEVRHDWGRTLSEMLNENFFQQIEAWATSHGTQFRSQNYGTLPAMLSSNASDGMAEGEGSGWDRFSPARWAASANFLLHRPVTSAETWTWLHTTPFRATPLDMKAEADQVFLEGVNQLVGHGWPYSPADVPEPGWPFYAAGAFNDHNPWWIVMPDLMSYLQRISYLLRQGTPVDDVAVLLPTDDIFSGFSPGNVSVSEAAGKFATPALTHQILSAGLNFIYIDDDWLEHHRVMSRVLILPHVERMSPQGMRALKQYVDGGGTLIVVGALPQLAPGLLHQEEQSAQVRQLAAELLSPPRVHVAPQEREVQELLQSVLKPDVDLGNAAGVVGFQHRQLADGSDLYFFANTSNRAIDTVLHFREHRNCTEFWSPFDSRRETLPAQDTPLHLEAYGSAVVVRTDRSPDVQAAQSAQPRNLLMDLSRGWEVTFRGAYGPEDTTTIDRVGWWTNDPAHLNFSGVAVYSKTFDWRPRGTGSKRLLLDFGEAKPAPQDPPRREGGMSAALDVPVREAAVIRINGRDAGFLWHPPYVLDVTDLVKAGENKLEVEVANTAINTLAAQPNPDFRLLELRYGNRFQLQDMDTLKPLPSGLRGPVGLWLGR